MTCLLFDKSSARKIVCECLHGFSGGELFAEDSFYELIMLKDGVVEKHNVSSSSGFALRGFRDANTVTVCSSDLTEHSIKMAAEKLKSSSLYDESGKIVLQERQDIKRNLYTDINSINTVLPADKFLLLSRLETLARSKEPAVQSVTSVLAVSWQNITVIMEDGAETSDIRPLLRVSISLVVAKNGKTVYGRASSGGRTDYMSYVNTGVCEELVNEALSEACANLEAKPAPAGEMIVVLGPGWPGVLLHEAVGHGLEGDFNRKKSSVYSDCIGTKIASDCVTVIDDGTIPNKRGSLNFDDEGIPSERNVLIEDGKLVKYMQDRLNARLMGVSPTGNGRREAYDGPVMPRMTNTFMMGGQYEKEEIIASVKKGLYAVNFGGGQVDITSGSFVFSSSKAYMIEDGQITYPVKDVSLIGKGSDVLKSISMLGNDLKLDNGSGTCSKNGQQVPVGVGQPTLKIDKITVGGTGL